MKEIAPRRYEIVRERGAPVVPGDPCGPTTVRVTLKPMQPDKAYVATFRYEAGILVNVEAQDADLVAGEFDAPAR